MTKNHNRHKLKNMVKNICKLSKFTDFFKIIYDKFFVKEKYFKNNLFITIVNITQKNQYNLSKICIFQKFIL